MTQPKQETKGPFKDSNHNGVLDSKEIKEQLEAEDANPKGEHKAHDLFIGFRSLALTNEMAKALDLQTEKFKKNLSNRIEKAINEPLTKQQIKEYEDAIKSEKDPKKRGIAENALNFVKSLHKDFPKGVKFDPNDVDEILAHIKPPVVIKVVPKDTEKKPKIISI